MSSEIERDALYNALLLLLLLLLFPLLAPMIFELLPGSDRCN
jgi:hypothetical protein